MAEGEAGLHNRESVCFQIQKFKFNLAGGKSFAAVVENRATLIFLNFSDEEATGQKEANLTLSGLREREGSPNKSVL